MKPIKLTVSRITESKANGYSTVKVCPDAYNAMLFAINKHFDRKDELQGTPMKYDYLGRQNGQTVQLFDFDGVKVWNSFNKEAGVSSFVMKTEDAKALFVETPDVSLPFVFMDFTEYAGK
jgi:hypothetical protein